jgi:hypothetical protein
MDQSFSVAQKPVTGSITALDKTYDGTTAATLATRTLSGVVGSDDVSLSRGTAAFADKNAGSGKTVTATGLSLSGADAGKYQLASTSATTTADIGAPDRSITANNKVYDGTTATIATRPQWCDGQRRREAGRRHGDFKQERRQWQMSPRRG